LRQGFAAARSLFEQAIPPESVVIATAEVVLDDDGKGRFGCTPLAEQRVVGSYAVCSKK